MQYEHHNYNNFIISFAKHFCPKKLYIYFRFIYKNIKFINQTQINVKDKKNTSFLIINMFLHEKKSNLHITNQFTT